MTAINAIGPREGDYLTLANAWAEVTITRDPDGYRGQYRLSGDIRHDAPDSFATLADAIREAWKALAEYEIGRMD